MFLALLILRGGFFLKWKGHFSFWGSALQVFRQCGRASIRTRQSENLFFWGKGFFALPRLISRPQKGVWGMNAGGSCVSNFGGQKILKAVLPKKQYQI